MYELYNLLSFMSVNVLFFGATAEITGSRRVEVLVPEPTMADVVFEQVLGEFPALRGHKLLFSVNQEYAPANRIVNDGDELAVFTAVSGG